MAEWAKRPPPFFICRGFEPPVFEPWVIQTNNLKCDTYCSLKALSHQTSSHYILQIGLRMAWLPENVEQVQSFGHPSPFRMFGAHRGSLYYVQAVCIQFEPIQTNVMRTSFVWRGYNLAFGKGVVKWGRSIVCSFVRLVKLNKAPQRNNYEFDNFIGVCRFNSCIQPTSVVDPTCRFWLPFAGESSYDLEPKVCVAHNRCLFW